MKVETRYVGHVTDCPKCGYTFVVPDDGEISVPASLHSEWDVNLVERCAELREHVPQKKRPESRENGATEFQQSLIQMAGLFSTESHSPGVFETEMGSASAKNNFSSGKPRRTLLVSGCVILLMAGFLGLFPSFSEKDPSDNSELPFQTQAEPAHPAHSDTSLNLVETESQSEPIQLEGRLRVRTKQGDFQELKHASIVMLPESPQSSLLMVTLGIDQGASPENRELARQRLSGASGAFAISDEQGAYQLHLKRAGTYYLLVLSDMLPETLVDGDELIEYETVLANYFQQPQELLKNSPAKLLKVTVQDDRMNFFDLDLERS